MSRVGSVFTVTVVHTKVRLQSTELRKNVPWRPLVEIPLPSLDPGSYRVEVVWQAVETVAAPKLLSEPIKRATGFVISSR